MSDVYQDEIRACARGERGNLRRILAQVMYLLFVILGVLLCLAAVLVLLPGGAP